MWRSWLLVVAAGILGAGCLVETRQVSDPEPVFARARAEAQEAARTPGPARELGVLAWDSSGELVEVQLPMWLVRKAARDGHLDLDGEGARLSQRIGDRLTLKDIEKAGRGFLLEIAEEDGGRVLVSLR